jgi:hypothetical protein
MAALQTADGTRLFGCEDVERAILYRLEGSAPVVIVVLFGKPGRGKTSLAHAIGRSRATWFEDINASSERRSGELRRHLSKFLSDGSQHALRRRKRLEGASWSSERSSEGAQAAARASPTPSALPLGLLFLDEADGLGAIGQATVASFVADLEDGGAPAREGWRACIFFACNDMNAMHDSLLSRAHVLAEMPRPSPATLTTAACAWMEAEGVRGAAGPERLAEMAVRADGDFRAMRQLLSMALALAAQTPSLRSAESWSDAERGSMDPQKCLHSEGARESPSLRSDFHQSPSLRSDFHQATAAGLGGSEPERGSPMEPEKCLHSEGGHRLGPLRCPRGLMRALVTGEGETDLSLWSDVWREGHRADVVVGWVELAASDPKATPERRVRLIRFRAQLADPSRPSTLLQLVGSFARTVYLGK